jgi:hypothetical protein
LGGWEPEVRVKDLKVGRQHFTFPGAVDLSDVRLVLGLKGGDLVVDVPGMRISGLQTFFSRERMYRFVLAGASVVFPGVEVREVGADLMLGSRSGADFLLSGPVRAGTAKWDRVKAVDVDFFLSAVPGVWEFRACQARAFGGEVTGRGVLDFSNGFRYEAEIAAIDLGTAELAQVNPGIAGQLGGRVSGTVRLGGRDGRMETLTTDVGMPAGGEMSARLLAALAQYIPSSREKKRLDAVIKAGGRLNVEVLSFSLKSETPRHLSGGIHIISKEVNLELNITNDIRTDGTLESLLSYWQTYVK